MRRLTGLLFLSLYALTFTECHQALKLPLLFEHYEHHASTMNITFVEFLIMHYETDIAHDNDDTDNDEDMQLPFKTCDHSQILTSLALVSQRITLKEPTPLTASPQVSFYQPISPSLLSHDIFQPPKA
ncbi:MAG TPA: hypothetical protein VFE50_26465 [Cyclobacteriaceae bacterium]|nr:hypothetical protein [Cyclobacteriaceae bacterium]